jgi:hypothetical protein
LLGREHVKSCGSFFGKMKKPWKSSIGSVTKTAARCPGEAGAPFLDFSDEAHISDDDTPASKTLEQCNGLYDTVESETSPKEPHPEPAFGVEDMQRIPTLDETGSSMNSITDELLLCSIGFEQAPQDVAQLPDPIIHASASGIDGDAESNASVLQAEVQRVKSEPSRVMSPPPGFKSRSLSNRWHHIRPKFARYLHTYRGKVEELSRRSMLLGQSPLMEDVVQNIIIPMTEEDAVSWVDFLDRHTEYVDITPKSITTTSKSRPFITFNFDVSADELGEPTTHVVHAWKMRFVDLLGAVLLDASNGKTRKLGESYDDACRIYSKVLHKPYWICCFCINQHLSICQEPRFKCRCSAPKYDETYPQCEFDKFAAVAKMLHHSGGRMLLALEKDLQALSRAWCVDEVHYALVTGMAIKPSFNTLPGFADLREFACEVRRCEARPRDKERILRIIQTGIGIPAFNARITNFLQKEADVLMQAARSRSRSISVTHRR